MAWFGAPRDSSELFLQGGGPSSAIPRIISPLQRRAGAWPLSSVQTLFRALGAGPAPPSRLFANFAVQLPPQNVWMNNPDRSFGSNQVLFGGMICPASAMSINCANVTG